MGQEFQKNKGRIFLTELIQETGRRETVWGLRFPGSLRGLWGLRLRQKVFLLRKQFLPCSSKVRKKLELKQKKEKFGLYTAFGKGDTSWTILSKPVN